MQRIVEYGTSIEREILEEMKEVFRRRFGQDYTEKRYDRLSTAEKEWVAHHGAVNAQRKRGKQI